MALRLNTVEYAFPQTTTQTFARGGVQNFSQITVEIPELTNRRFVSAYADVFTIDTLTTASTPNFYSFGIRCSSYGAGPFLNQRVDDVYSNGGENMSFHFLFDVSSMFINNFTTNASYVVDASFSIDTSAHNTSCKLVLTYEYDDSAPKRIKTVRIPLESSTGKLGTTLASIRGGGNDIPALDIFLPEASKAYRDIFFETWVNENTGSVANPNPSLGFALDGEAAAYDNSHEDAQSSARLYRRIWQRKDMNTATEHQFKAQTTTNTNMGFNHLGSLLNVTYTYDEASTTRVMNSLMLAAADEVGYAGGIDASSKTRFRKNLSIPDANPILKNSGILMTYIDSANVTTNVAVGSQAYTTYANTAAVVCGGFMFYHNFDASSRKGQGITLSPTGNFTLDFYTTSDVDGRRGSNNSAIMYLNYTADKSSLSGGSSNNPHTIIPFFCNNGSEGYVREVTRQIIDIPEHDRWVMDVAPVLSDMGSLQASTFNYFSAYADPSSYYEAGWVNMYVGMSTMDTEWSPMIQFARGAKVFKRWPHDTDTTRLYLEKERKFRYGSSSNDTHVTSYWPITYHTMITPVSGTITGYSGDGSGINIMVYDDTYLKEIIYEGSTNIGGTFDFAWFNPSINIRVGAYQDATHKGMFLGSINSSANIDFAAAAGAETSYVF